MKIAWLTPYPVAQLNDRLQGGVRKPSLHPCSWIMNLSRALAEHPDVELHLFTLCPWITRSQAVERDGMMVHVLKSGIPFTRRGWPQNMPLDTISGFFIDQLRLCAALRRLRPDIVHAHGTENAYALAAARAGYPYLISIQGIIAEFNKTDPSLHFKLMAPREKRVVEKSRWFTCRTHFDTGFVRRTNPAAHIFDIPEAMTPVFWEGQWDRPKEKRVLFIGGGAPRKGFHELIDAMAQVVKTVPDASVDAVGSFSPEQQKVFSEKAAQQGLTVRFHGFQPAAKIAELHRQCSMFILCSSNENSPNTLAEAMVSGMPCIAYNVGGVSSMVDDGVTGLLVKPHDVAALSAKIVELLVDGEKAQTLGAAAARIARVRHDPRHVAEETMNACRFILASR